MAIRRYGDIFDLPPAPSKIEAPVTPASQETRKKAPTSKSNVEKSAPILKAPSASKETIMQMQTALNDLYNKFKTYPIFNKDLANKYIEDYAGANQDSISFVLNKYLNKSKDLIKGQVSDMTGAIDKLKDFSVIQTPSGAKAAGVWDKSTDTALITLAAIMSGLISGLSAFGIKQSEYTEKNIQELKEAQKEKTEEGAQVIIKNIQIINKVLDTFIKALFQSSSVIKKDTSLMKINSDTLNVKEEEIANSQLEIPNLKIPQELTSNSEGNIPVKISDLYDLNNFKQFIAQNKITLNGKDPSNSPEELSKAILALNNKIQVSMQNQKKMMAGY